MNKQLEKMFKPKHQQWLAKDIELNSMAIQSAEENHERLQKLARYYVVGQLQKLRESVGLTLGEAGEIIAKSSGKSPKGTAIIIGRIESTGDFSGEQLKEILEVLRGRINPEIRCSE